MSLSAYDSALYANSLIWGKTSPNEDIFERWCQGFEFSENESTALRQANSGPCAVIAAVQAAILRIMIISDDFIFPLPADRENAELLAASLVDIFATVQHNVSDSKLFLFFWSENDSDMCPNNAVDEASPKVSHHASWFEKFMNGLRLVSSESCDELYAIILSLIPELQSKYGLLCFLYSVLLTHGLDNVRNGIAGETETLIDPTFGSASQCLLNLLITGKSTPHLFDGERNLSGFAMEGVTNQPKTGFLTLMEALHYCEVGWYLKNPSTPVWILGSETHFTVLASPEKNLVSVEEQVTQAGNDSSMTPQKSPLRPRANLRLAEREFLNLSESAESGFLAYDKFDVLLGRLGLAFDAESLATARAAVDPDGLGIILREPFLTHFFADEIEREKFTLNEFHVIHYNGLLGSNPGGHVRYRYGKANIVDPTDDANLSGKSPLDRCLKTKWPTIQVVWSDAVLPTLN